MSLFRRLLSRNSVFNTLKPSQQRIFVLAVAGLIALMTITMLAGLTYTHNLPYVSTGPLLTGAKTTNVQNTHPDIQSSTSVDDRLHLHRFTPAYTPEVHKPLTPATSSAASVAPMSQSTSPSSSMTSASGPMIPVNVTAYSLQGRMADGNWTHWGACAVYTGQFPFGTIINIYNQDGSFNRQCIAEDTGSAITYGHIDLAFPGDESAAIQWGRQYLYARVVR